MKTSKTTTVFQRVWLWLLIAIAAVETVALFRKGSMDTLSEYTRLKVASAPMRAALGGLLVWLCYHWLFATNGTPMGWRDVASSVAGIALGLVAHNMTERQ